jgi:cytochrome b subunit of formate dehydrogenase
MAEPQGAASSRPSASPAWPVVPDDFGAEGLKGSVHADLDCPQCHAPRPGQAPSVRQKAVGDTTHCDPCHSRETQAYDQSVHASALAGGKTGAARCRHCHGAHDIRKVSDPRSSVYKLAVAETCGRCHTLRENAAGATSAARGDQTSVHRRALVTQGLMGAPSCVDCHGQSHGIKRASEPSATTNRTNVPRTCGQCHPGAEQDYRRSTHGQLFARGTAGVPVCTDCHTAHNIAEPTARPKLGTEELCGKCHAAALRRYRQTYHGKALSLGHGEVATCYDCHGNHAILPASDPGSTVAPANRLATCRRCHPDATPQFAAFLPHGDHTDRTHYPLLYWTFVLMTSLIVGTFAIWGLHTLLWAVRMLIDLVRDPQGLGRARALARHEPHERTYVRFQPIDRFCHALVIVSFLLLVATGMPLKFPETPWARVIFSLVGGAEVAAALHRLGACLSLIYLLVHISRLLVALVRSRADFRDPDGRFRWRNLWGVVFGPDSPLPHPRDARDVVAHVKWFFGRGRRPAFDRFTYWEKFDYLAEFWGSAFIGLSGLVMWFPEAVTRIAPGWLVNVAHVIHSQEALLAAGFILTFHFFNSHFRTEKFPLDTVMFSGRITEAELLHERKRQHDRLRAEGRLEEFSAEDEWGRSKWIYGTLGLIAAWSGLALAIAIFFALGRRLLGG